MSNSYAKGEGVMLAPVQASPPGYASPPASHQAESGPIPSTATGQAYRDQLFAQCAAGNHLPKTSYGTCGIITAILCFPFGLICLFTDSRKICARCGELAQ